jgi:hypothetical protein
MLLAMDDTGRWQEQHPNVTVVFADEPVAGIDWRDQEGWGWIFKAWFRRRVGNLKPRVGGARCA